MNFYILLDCDFHIFHGFHRFDRPVISMSSSIRQHCHNMKIWNNVDLKMLTNVGCGLEDSTALHEMIFYHPISLFTLNCQWKIHFLP